MLDHLDLLDERHVTIIQEAIAEGRIGFTIQGIHAIRDRSQLLYGECLPRLTGQDGTEHPDVAFVPALEALGEAPVLDRHMLKLVLDKLESDSLAVLGCNISPDNLSDPANWAHIRDQIAARSQLAPRLVLKIAPNVPFPDIALAGDLLSEARDFGCRIAIDDNGCGYATLLRLWDIKADFVKIDGLFAPGPFRCHADMDALSLLIGRPALAAPVVVVEGIETVEQWEATRLAGANTHLGLSSLDACLQPIRKTDPPEKFGSPGRAGARE
ncbi:EAL domain-containing protein [Nitratireductor luteus]|uniref:EAL domain-containing protein n=1 Tax=Nitratireductor luteus TaxID=2976980 RepID=UPI00223F6E72